MRVFITGVSKGLGRSLALHFLNQGHKVTGIGRSHSINSPNFTFITCDLADQNQINQIRFGNIDEDVVFINNAGSIGNVERLSEQEALDVIDVMTINAIAPMVLSCAISAATPVEKLLTLVNISSGAGRRAIPSWASYCASKAALDLFSNTFYMEELERGRKIRVYSVAPGVIDTDMQKTIRNSKENSFSGKQRFLDLQINNELSSTEEVVKKLVKLIFKDEFTGEVICSL